jgi:hypothetical protein
LHEHDKILQATCENVLVMVAQAIDNEKGQGLVDLRLPGGPVVGKQLAIDATEKGGKLNKCRLTVLDVNQAPEGEAARIEYEHDKETKHGLTRVYSIQSVRRRAGKLELLENFLATSPEDVREADFRPIQSEAYAQQTVLGTLRDWALYRAWQLQEQRKK